MGRFTRFRSRVAELIDASRESEPEPKGYQGEERAAGLIRGGILEHEPPREELQEYRKIYENVGPVKGAINNFVSEVIEPGWYITADDPDTQEQMTEYFKNVGIVNYETNVDFAELLDALLVEREVRGTAFVEKVADDSGRQQALYPLQNDTITIYSKPGKAMFPAPDDDTADPVDPTLIQERDEPPVTDTGEMGAFVQFDDVKPKWSHTDEVVYTRDQVIHWPRDGDIGDPRGTSRIAAIKDRAEGLLEKLQDNDDAVKFKAWPQILFLMGTEERPWSEEEVENFIENYEGENMSPGLMQAVSGDVSVEEFAGEVADIEGTLNFDISMIMSGLPGPVYSIGGFSENVAPAVAQQQQRQFIKEVKDTRRAIESKFTPYAQDVAEDYGLDAADSVEINLGRPRGEIAPEDVQGSIIRYSSDATNGEDQVVDRPTVPISSDDVVTSPEDVEDSNGNGNGSGSSENAARYATELMAMDVDELTEVDHEPFRGGDAELDASVEGEELDVASERSSASLADPRLVSTTEQESDLQGLVSEVLVDVRETLLEPFDEAADVRLMEADELAQIAEERLESRLTELAVASRVEPTFESITQRTLDTMSQENHTPQIDVDVRGRHRDRIRRMAERFDAEVETAARELYRDVAEHARQVEQHGEVPSVVTERVRNDYDDTDLSNRARVMSRIESNSAVNEVKRIEYEQHDDVVGLKLINPCNQNTTRLCRDLVCRNDDPIARFDGDGSIGQQFQSQTRDELLFDGFTPLPTIPPFHFGCRTEIVPVTTNE